MLESVRHSLGFLGISLQASSQINFLNICNYALKNASEEKVIPNTHRVPLCGVARGDPSPWEDRSAPRGGARTGLEGLDSAFSLQPASPLGKSWGLKPQCREGPS